MNFEQLLLIALLVYTGIREALYHSQTQKLVNKIMSKNYYDFKISENVDKINEVPKSVVFPPEVAEDFGSLSDYTGMM